MEQNKLQIRLKEIIENAIKLKILNAAAVRVIGVQLNKLSTKLIVFASNNWSKNLDFGDRYELGKISLSSWLDELDAQASPTNHKEYVQQGREAKKKLHHEVEQALHNLVSENYTTKFERIPLFICEGFTRYYTSVAWAHPHGTEKILNVSICPENEYSSDYPTATLHDQGVTLFYPAGIGSGLGMSDKSSEQCTIIKEIDFDKVMLAYEAGKGKVFFKQEGDVSAYQLEVDNVSSKYSKSQRKEIGALIVSHFLDKSSRFLNLKNPPDPEDKKEFLAWMDVYKHAPESFHSAQIEIIYKKYDINAAQIFMDAISVANKSYSKNMNTLVSLYMDEKNWKKALEESQKIRGKGRVWLSNRVVRILIMLGRFDEAVKEAQAVAVEANRKSAPLSLQAVAYTFLKDEKQAIAIAGALVEDEPDQASACYALACAFQISNPEKSLELYKKSATLDGYSDEYTEYDFQNGPEEIKDFVRQKKILKQKQSEQSCFIDDFEKISIPVDSINRELKLYESTDIWQRTDFLPGFDYGDYETLIALDESFFIACGRSGATKICSIDFDTKNVNVQEIGAEQEYDIEDVCCVKGFIYTLQNDGHIRIYARDNPEDLITLIEPNSSQSVSKLENLDDLLCVAHDNGVDMYNIGEAESPEYINTISSFRCEGGDLCTDVKIYRHEEKVFLFIGLNRLGLISVDISKPLEPVILQALKPELLKSSDEFSVSRILMWKNYLLIDGDANDTWFVDISRPHLMKSLGGVPCVHQGCSLYEQNELSLLHESCFYIINISNDSVSIEGIKSFGNRQSPLKNNLLIADKFIYIDSDVKERDDNYDDEEFDYEEEDEDEISGFVINELEPKEKIDVSEMLQAYKENSYAWIENCIRKALEEKPEMNGIGVVKLSFDAYWLHITLESARSAINLDTFLPGEYYFQSHVSVDEIVGSKDCGEKLAGLPQALFTRITRDVLTGLDKNNELKKCAAKQVHLIDNSTGRGIYVQCLAFPDAKARPYREAEKK